MPLTNLFGQSARELQSVEDELTRECAVQDIYEKPKNASLNNLLLLSYAFRGVFVVYLLYLAGQGELQGHILFFLLLLMQTFTASSISAANSFEKLLQSMSLFENAAKALFDFDQRAPTNTLQGSKLSGAIRVVDLAYSYEESQKALNGISTEIAEGEKVAIVGESGSGKSTLFNILSGQLTPDGGSIWAGDINISELSPDLWNQHVSIVPQTISLFNRSVASNVGYALDQLHPEKVVSAAQKANSDHFIEDTAEGYNTFMGEGGHRFSGGQRQRISIARSFAKDAAIYLLDEPTSTLDQHAEQHIFSSLNDDFDGKTVVVVTHRLKHIDLFDRVIVMSNGQIVEDGPPEQLLSSDGHLKQLWKAQEVSWSNEPGPVQKTEPASDLETTSNAPIQKQPFKDGVADEIVTFEDIEIPRLLKIATPAMRILVLAGACMAGILAMG